MSTQDLHSVMEENIGEELNGILLFDGQTLKLEYDGIEHLHDELEEHLDFIAHEDKEIIENFITDYDDFVVTEPETHDTFVYFYIET